MWMNLVRILDSLPGVPTEDFLVSLLFSANSGTVLSINVKAIFTHVSQHLTSGK